MLPKSCCLAIGATFAAELLLRVLATSTRGAEVCAQAGHPKNKGKIRRTTRAEKRFILSTHLYLGEDAERPLQDQVSVRRARRHTGRRDRRCGMVTLARGRTVRHNGNNVFLCYLA